MHLLLGRAGEFEARVAERIALDPHSVSLRLSLAEFHTARGEAERAFALFEEALAIEPASEVALRRLGLAAQALGRLGRAATVFEALAAEDPENVAALHHFGIALAGEAGALRARSVALRSGGDEERAATFEESARATQVAALAAFRRTVELAPGRTPAREDLAFTLFASGQTAALRESLEHYAVLLALRPADPGLHLELGQVRFALGELKSAENALAEVTSLAPDLPQAWVLLGQIRQALGRPEAARECLRKARSLTSPGPGE
jgi:tetratricopeptide (TPR) repeat protein